MDKLLLYLVASLIAISSILFSMVWRDVELKRIEADKFIGCVAYHGLKDCRK